MDKSNYGVITEQGFPMGQFGFNGMSKEEHDKLLNENNKADEEKQS